MKSFLEKVGKKILRAMPVLGVVLFCAAVPQMSVSAGYSGISIDGDFSDWENVQKYPGANGVNEVAFVFDGDYMYIYIDEPEQAFSATWSGSHSNGKFTIVTDLGYETLFQLTQENNGSVSGVDGALWAHSDTTWGLPGYYWEIAIPTGNLQPYNETVSFGHYLGENMYVSDIANLAGDVEQGGGEGEESGVTETGGESGETSVENPSGSFDGIAYDGSYDDWTYYPHDVLEYATAGTQEEVVDAQAALYSVDGILFGHVVTYMQKHLNEAGGEYTSGVTIQVNNDWATTFYPEMVLVDGAGNINYTPQLGELPQGSYEFYMIDSQGWKNATNISEWTDPNSSYYGTNAVYGKMMINVGPSKDDMEYWIDIPTLMAKFGMDAGDAKVLSAQYSRIGQQWVTTAGTSSGPIVGVVLCMSVVACSMIRKRRMEVGKAA